MRPEAPTALLAKAQQWERLSRWERSEIGRDLRRLGWTYGEIEELIPVPKGTLAHWCRDVILTEAQIAAIKRRRPPGVRTGIPIDTQRRRRLEVARLQAEARSSAALLRSDPAWVAGTVLYWAEGDKTKRMLSMSNTDPRILRLFIGWVRAFHMTDAGFVLALHLHEGNDESEAKSHWRAALILPEAGFTKTFVKPSGTGHRKNHLAHGVCRVRVRRSTDAWFRTMAWIQSLGDDPLLSVWTAGASVPPGR